MKNLIYLLILALPACQPSTSLKDQSENTVDQIEDNEELIRLHAEDQGDRKTPDVDWTSVSERDQQRRDRVYQLLDSNQVVTSLDYSNAAMIFQHGNDTTASGMAVRLMRKAIELDSTADKWLLAAAVDRDLMRRGEPQIYGTQYVRNGDGPWVLYQLDSTQISDTERIEHGVKSLSVLMAEEKEKMLIQKQ